MATCLLDGWMVVYWESIALMKLQRLSTQLAALVALFLGGVDLTMVPARAVIVHGSFTGVISQASDTDGLFGISPQALMGTQMSGTFSYNVALLPPAVTVVFPVSYSWYGAYQAPPTIAMSEIVNGVTVHFDGSYFEDMFTTHSAPPIIGQGDGEVPSFQEFGIETCNISPFSFTCGTISVGAADNSVHIIGDPSNPVVSFSRNNIPQGYAVGGGSVASGACPGPLCPEWAFDVTSIAVGVPEPGNFWLLASGVAMLGIREARRVRRRAATVPTRQ